MRDRDEKDRQLGAVIRIVAEGAVKLFLVVLAIVTLFTSQ